MPVVCPNHPSKVRGKGEKPVYFFITLVKFPPGKTAQGFMDAVRNADVTLHARGEKTRHERGIHEELTFVALGRYDMIMVWHAPDAATMGKYWEELHALCGPELGTTETLSATSIGVPKDP